MVYTCLIFFKDEVYRRTIGIPSMATRKQTNLQKLEQIARFLWEATQFHIKALINQKFKLLDIATQKLF